MLGYVGRYTHAYEIWSVFDNLFTSQYKARAMNLRLQLQTLNNGTLSTEEFVLHIHTIADCLHASGHILSDDELIMYFL